MNTNPNKKSHLGDAQARTAWLFCAPAILLILVFIVAPFAMSVGYSFTNRMLVPKKGTVLSFTGLANYIKIFTSSTALNSFQNTFVYALLVVPAPVLLGTLLAIFVNWQMRGVKVFRMIYFSPQVVTMTVVAVVWSFILSSNSEGIMNSLLGLFGVEPQRWLQDARLALLCIAIMYIWQNLGMQMLIILGGLQYISEDLYEAAMIDGCNNWNKFWNITVPCLKNTLVYVLVSTTISSLKLFTQVYVLTDGGPQNSTTTVVYLLYKAGFINGQLGYSSAISVVFFILVFAISQFQNKVLGED